MTIHNFLDAKLTAENIHEGTGLCPHSGILSASDFETPVRFVNYTILPAGTSFGAHKHGDDNELYIVLEGSGHYTCNGETVPCKAGDILVNPRFGTHSIVNDSQSQVDLRLLVMEVYNK